MLFNSFEFLLFFPALLLIYYLVPGNRFKHVILILGSTFFIYKAGILSLLIIALLTVMNYFLGIAIHRRNEDRAGKSLFITAILLNIANLFFFKYYNFFNANLEQILGLWNGKDPLPYLDIVLPLGISFYTFQLLGYLIDIRIGNHKPEKDFLVFTNYVFFFPKMIAGPIERAGEFLPQSLEGKKPDVENFSEGAKLVIWGFFQKLVIADRIAIYVDTMYSDIGSRAGLSLLICTILYTFQVYADFSGYTDIARGLARILGFRLMENFHRPLLAKSVTEFWRRWHISLSSWVNDYIYTPLTLKYRNMGLGGVILSLFISFIIIGIWHGAQWTYVVFGLLQGTIITLELVTLRSRKKLFKPVLKPLVVTGGVLFSFAFISVSMVFFRAPTLEEAFTVLSNLSFSGKLYIGHPTHITYSLIGVLVLLVHDVLAEYYNINIFRIRSRFFGIRSLPYAILVVLILMLGVFDGGQFIYFKF